jgi:hypothetical protein
MQSAVEHEDKKMFIYKMMQTAFLKANRRVEAAANANANANANAVTAGNPFPTRTIYRVDHKVGQFFFLKSQNFQIVRVFCATKIFFFNF